MKTVFVAGHKGMVGSAICRLLSADTNIQLLTADRKDLDLTNQDQVKQFFNSEKIDEVIIAGAKVGGINANNLYPAEFIYENILIQSNIIHQSHLNDVNKLLFLGSSCIYPKYAEQPIKENSLLSGPLESTNEPYAIAKIAGIKMCESYNRQYKRDYRSVMPTNLYGPGDNYHPEDSHVIAGLLMRFHKAKIENLDNVTVWGSGRPKREFLYIDDMARACCFIFNLNKDLYSKELNYNNSHINIGSGKEISILDLSNIIKKIVGFKGNIIFDQSKPDGTPRKLLDISRLDSLGWQSKIDLFEGLNKTYAWLQDSIKKGNFRY